MAQSIHVEITVKQMHMHATYFLQTIQFLKITNSWVSFSAKFSKAIATGNVAGEADLLPVPLEAVAVQVEVEALEVGVAPPVAEVAVVVVVEAVTRLVQHSKPTNHNSPQRSFSCSPCRR